jgi:hypothetical protein
MLYPLVLIYELWTVAKVGEETKIRIRLLWSNKNVAYLNLSS